MAKSIGVLIVDDSAFMRKVISDILGTTEDIKVLSTAKDGVEALEKAKALNPDIITLDVEMPVMDGLKCLKELQKITNAPIIMLSSITKSGAISTIEALEAGAIDFVTKPTGLFDIAGEEKRLEIIEKIRMAKGIKKSRTSHKNGVIQNIKSSMLQNVPRSSTLKTVIAIGTSTGGPKALQEVIPFIPGDISAAVLIVQHMPAGFTKSLADRLNSISELTVKEAENGEEIKAGYAYIAPGDYHMTVIKKDTILKIVLNKEPQVGGHRPAINVMMNSLAHTAFTNVIGVIMTGMGADGSEGIMNIKKFNRGTIISQDEKSCVIYGMPKAAVQTGIVDLVVPLKEIANEIVKNLGV
jgi:two-component system, chemotaxis family, protein-glutamate methylesterase/glutaminase